ncbi:DciA family protein [Streptomyces sp. NPDC002088]|uniref:DciA family protein n=1 Tax=Streptomyces sp. NPDC002088 TaxID=3154665 RepID=UPI0033275E81
MPVAIGTDAIVSPSTGPSRPAAALGGTGCGRWLALSWRLLRVAVELRGRPEVAEHREAQAPGDGEQAIAPGFAGHVAAVGYDADSGRLTLCPESAAWATRLRLEQAGVVEAANQSAGRTVVRGLRTLAPRSVPVPGPDDVAAPASAPKGPAKTRENACDGYRRALAAHQEVRPVSRVDTAIAEAAERQSRAMRELSARAFPEPEAGLDDAPAPIETTRAQRRRQAAAAEAAALRRARAERAAREGGTAAVVAHPASLRTTA